MLYVFTCILFLFFALTMCECYIEIKGYLRTYLFLLDMDVLNTMV